MDILTGTISDTTGTVIDWQMGGAELATDQGLQTAVVLSLFTDRLANVDDALPDTGGRRGWWGDSYADTAGDLFGSRLWLLSREKRLPLVLERARQYAKESLDWLIEDGVASAVSVDVEFQGEDRLAFLVEITRPIDGPLQYRFTIFWKSL